MVNWSRLIRFEAEDGKIYRGEPIVDGEDVDIGQVDGLKARVIEGDDIFSESCKVTDKILPVVRLLGPLEPSQVQIVRCVGLNYATHKLNNIVREAGRKPPPYPSIFIKGAESVADHGSDVPIPKICQDDQADYEGELVAVIGKTCKNVKKEDALQYIAAYTTGDDVSARKWQRDPKFAGGVPQWCFSKGFDKFAPLGPCLVSSEIIKDPSNLKLQTIVNGVRVQDTHTSDLVFDVPTLVEFLSQGTTLTPGSIIMTGTPGGVGSLLDPPQYLKPGDQVEVWVEDIGTLKHGISYD